MGRRQGTGEVVMTSWDLHPHSGRDAFAHLDDLLHHMWLVQLPREVLEDRHVLNVGLKDAGEVLRVRV